MTPRERAYHLVREMHITMRDYPTNGAVTAIEMCITAAVEAEREECAKIANGVAVDRRLLGQNEGDLVAKIIEVNIRARSNADARSAAPEEK